MPYKLDRPAPTFDLALGLMLAKHFQVAYVTNDIERTTALFRDRLGIAEFRTIEGPTPDGGHIRSDLALVGTLMYEIVEAHGEDGRIFSDRLPACDGFAARHHHLGYLVHDRAQWDGIVVGAARAGWPAIGRTPNALVRACFVDAPELGHYLEYLLPTPAGLAFFDAVPRS
jgi:hypothetical protein